MQTIDQMQNQYLTIREAARQFDVSEAGLRNRIARGVLPAKRFGYARLIERALLERLFGSSPR